MSEEWVSISEAAKRLTAAGDRVDRSTLSRYLKQHGEALPLKDSGKSRLVEFGALTAHRGENIRIQMRQGDADPAAKKTDAGKPQPTVPSGQMRKAMAEAEIKELELAQRRGQLVPVGEVDEGARDAVALMNSAFDRAIDGEAATLSVKYGWDERTVRLALKQFAKHGTEVFHREILKRLDVANRDDGGEDRARSTGPAPASYELQ